MKMKTLSVSLLISFCFFLMSGTCLFAEEVEEEAPEPPIFEGKTLDEILEEEKSRKYAKIDTFLKDFDKGFSQSMGEKFEDLLKEEEFLEEGEEISTDSFETFNKEFDKIIEEDLADFELFEINTDHLDQDFLQEESLLAEGKE